jgi:hypothetical protein
LQRQQKQEQLPSQVIRVGPRQRRTSQNVRTRQFKRFGQITAHNAKLIGCQPNSQTIECLASLPTQGRRSNGTIDLDPAVRLDSRNRFQAPLGAKRLGVRAVHRRCEEHETTFASRWNTTQNLTTAIFPTP